MVGIEMLFQKLYYIDALKMMKCQFLLIAIEYDF